MRFTGKTRKETLYMPTSRGKNVLYRLSLPFLSPALPVNPVLFTEGRELTYKGSFVRIVRRNHITGGAFAFSSEKEQAFVFTKAVHDAKAQDKHTYYRVASITKMATALTAVILMDQGILDPQKSVSDIIPDGRKIPELDGILIGDLLSHTSGLVDPPGLEKMLTDRVPLREAVTGCRKSDKSFRYSNLGYGIVGCVFESLLGIPVEKIFRDFLFTPLALDATLSGATLVPNSIMPVKRILPWRRENAVTVTPLGMIPLVNADPDYHFGYTAGSMYITLPSLVRLTECIRDNGFPFVSGEYSYYMKKETARYGSISPTLAYGHGLLIIRDKSISSSAIFGHQGFAYGCVDGAFWEESTGNIVVSLNGGCSEARTGRLGIANRDLCRYAFRKEIPSWK